MTLGTFLSRLIDELAPIGGKPAIEVLTQLKLQPAVFDECLDELVCRWIADNAIPAGEEPVRKFTWFEHLKSESAGFINCQLDVVTLSESEQAEIQITILYRAGLLSAQSGKRFEEELEAFSRLTKSHDRNDEHE